VLGKLLSGKEEVGRIVLLLLAIHPNGIAYAQLLSAEVPFLLLVLGGILLNSPPSPLSWEERGSKEIHSNNSNDLLKAPSLLNRGGLGVNLTFVFAGILFGLATLVKSQGLLLPLVFGIAIYLNGEAERRRGWINKFAVIYLFLGIILTPWLIRNYLVFDAFPVLVTNGSANLLVGNNPFANGKYKWGDQEIAWYEAQAPQAVGEIAHAQKAKKLAFQYMQENPGETLRRIPQKLGYTYAHDYEGLDWLRESCGGLSGWKHRLMQGFKAFGQMLYLVVLFLVSSSWIRYLYQHITKSAHQHIHNLLIYKSANLLILLFSLLVIIVFGDGRFHFPLMPFLFLLAAIQLIPNNSPEQPGEQAQA
jgi:hypothetical protein